MVSGLREQKKVWTREAIATSALELFAERGFDDVTVAEIAARARVSKKTVFNYFASKEDLYFDHDSSVEEALVRAVIERPDGVTRLAALRAFLEGGMRGMDRELTIDPRSFARIFVESPDLQAHVRELFFRYEDALATALATEEGAKPDDVGVRVTASAMVSVFRVAFEQGMRRLASGRRVAQMRRSVLHDVDRGIDALRQELNGAAS